MPKYFADANIFLRFLLKDHAEYFNLAKTYFEQAQDGRITVFLATETVLEINYVLRGVYTLSRQETAEKLPTIVQAPYLKVLDREILIEVVDKYKLINADLADLILYEKAQLAGAEVLTFDKSDFKMVFLLNPAL